MDYLVEFASDSMKELEERKARLRNGLGNKELPPLLREDLEERMEAVNQLLQEQATSVDEGLVALRAGHAAYMSDYNLRTGRTKSHQRGRPRKA